MICSKCNTYIDSGDGFGDIPKFCSHCGSKIDYNRCSEGCNLKEDSVFPVRNNESRILDDKDLYCKFCGAKSTYFVQGILKAKED